MKQNRRKNGQYDHNELCACCGKPNTDEFFGIENPSESFLAFSEKSHYFFLGLCEKCADEWQKIQSYFEAGSLTNPYKFNKNCIEKVSKKELKAVYVETLAQNGYAMPFCCSPAKQAKIESLVKGGFRLPDSVINRITETVAEMEHFINVVAEGDTIYIKG